MRNVIIAALGLGVIGAAVPAPASAQTLRVDRSIASATTGAPGVTEVQYRRNWNGRYRGGYNRRYYGGRNYGRGNNNGAAIGAGIAGLAAGAIIGGAIANSQQQTYYGAPQVSGGDAVSYCMQRFRSYDPNSGTYLGYDGNRHACP